jgi:hypothetical protein
MRTVRNPLTVVAIFAGSSEVAGIAILPLLAESTQAVYVWFLMSFPILVLLLFFATLNWNHKVFYAPSDFKDEDNFFKAFQPASSKERTEKLKDDVRELSPLGAEAVTRPSAGLSADTLRLFRQDPRTLYSLVEEFVIGELEKEFRTVARRELSLRSRFGNFVFDAILESGERKVIVEVKLITKTSRLIRMRETLQKIQAALFGLPLTYKKGLTVILAIAYDLPDPTKADIESELRSMILDFDFPIDLRFYAVTDLTQALEKQG